MQALSDKRLAALVDSERLAIAIHNAALLVGENSHLDLFPIKEDFADAAAIIRMMNP